MNGFGSATATMAALLSPGRYCTLEKAPHAF